MIHNYDRRYWFGASDGKYIFAESHNRSWDDWWDVKCGKKESDFRGNIFTKAGNAFEHSILKTYDPNINFDRQILIPSLRLRVNLDGNTTDEIFEVKTYKNDKRFVVNDAYYYQAQLQMLAWSLETHVDFVDCEGKPKLQCMNPPLKKHVILAYGLYPDEYYGNYDEDQIENGLIPIDVERIQVIEVKPSRSIQRKGRKLLKKYARQLRKDELI
jgi:hypothetical protein